MSGSQPPEIQLHEDCQVGCNKQGSHHTKETKVLLLGKLAPKAVTVALSTADRRKGVFVQI